MITKKYYIAKIIGTGLEEDPFRPKVSDYQIDSMVRTCQDSEDWCLVLVGAEDHTIWKNDLDINEVEEF